MRHSAKKIIVSPLNETYQQKKIHATWTSVYRSAQSTDFNDAVMEELLPVLSLKPGSRVLDAGCGTGAHTARFVQHGFACTGIDISDHVISIASAMVPGARFLSAPLENVPLPANCFDCVHCRGVLMHIPEWQTALAELCRVLKTGGKIVILDGNKNALETWLVRAIRLFRHSSSKLVKTTAGLEFWSENEGKPFLVRYFSVDQLAKALEVHGIAIDRILPFELFDIARFPAALRPALNRLNHLWLTAHMAPQFSHGVAIVGTKY